MLSGFLNTGALHLLQAGIGVAAMTGRGAKTGAGMQGNEGVRIKGQTGK
jgi:hypothetical protein